MTISSISIGCMEIEILPIGDGGMFRVCEEFVDRFENVPLAVFNTISSQLTNHLSTIRFEQSDLFGFVD